MSYPPEADVEPDDRGLRGGEMTLLYLPTRIGPLSQRELARIGFLESRARLTTRALVSDRTSADLSGPRQVAESLRTTWSLLADRASYDVCIFDSHFGVFPALLLRQLGRARMLAYDDLDYRPAFSRTRAGTLATRILERVALRRSDLVSSVSRPLAERCSGLTRSPVRLVPNGIHFDAYAESRARRERVREVTTLVYVGYVARNRGVFDPLPLLAREGGALAGMRYLVVGAGPDAPALQAAVRGASLDSWVEVREPVPAPQVPAVLAQGDIALALYHPDSHAHWASPLKVIESLAAGLPVVTCSYVPMASELAARGCAFIADTLAEVGRAIARLRDLESYRRASRAAVELAREYDWDAILEPEYAFWRSLLPRTDGRADDGPS